VVHGIVASAGGAIRVESAPGKGATFEVYWPRLERQAPGPTEKTQVAPRGKERILLVEDEPLVRSAHRRVIQSLGYLVTEARDGVEALELIRRAPADFDLVFTDQSMPRLSGAELAQALHAEYPRLGVILCSGYAEAVDEAAAQAMGVRALLEKPVDRQTLAAALCRAIDASGEPPTSG
jgi:CheY-like chemotaxis protein